MNTNPEERRRVQSGASSWLATLAGALVLVALGFGVGLVAGTAYEDPALVAEHLSGRSTEVAFGPGESLDAAGLPVDDVAAAPPPLAEPEAELEVEPAAPLGAGALDAQREAPSAMRPAPAPLAAAPAPAAPAAAAKPGTAGFSIQVGAFGSEATARQLAAELGKRGYPAHVASEGAGARFKVRVGPLASRAEAERVAARLSSEHRLPTWILASAPGARAN
jgi:cell division septation protein DedD